MWKILFLMANRSDRDLLLRHVILELVPRVLPCKKCREHYAKHMPTVTRRAQGLPNTGKQAFRWLWFAKDEVNRMLRVPSQPLEYIEMRYDTMTVDEVETGDLIAWIAFNAPHDAFAEWCHALAVLLPLPKESQFREALELVESRTAIADAIHAAAVARKERGYPTLSRAAYKRVATR